MRHDRGAFGELMAKVRAAGFRTLHFNADLEAPEEDAHRWSALAIGVSNACVPVLGHGRTGEEALRLLVSRLP